MPLWTPTAFAFQNPEPQQWKHGVSTTALPGKVLRPSPGSSLQDRPCPDTLVTSLTSSPTPLSLLHSAALFHSPCCSSNTLCLRPSGPLFCLELSLRAVMGILEMLEFLPNVTFAVSCSPAPLWNSTSPPVSWHVFIRSLSSSQLDFSLPHRQKTSLCFILCLEMCLHPMVGSYQIFVPLTITYKRKSG